MCMVRFSKHGEESMKRVNITLPESLVEEIDLWVKKKGYRSRSAFIEEAIKHYLEHLRSEGE